MLREIKEEYKDWYKVVGGDNSKLENKAKAVVITSLITPLIVSDNMWRFIFRKRNKDV